MTPSADSLRRAREWIIAHQYNMPSVEFDGGVREDLAALLDAVRADQKERDAKVAELGGISRCMGHQRSGKGVCGDDIAAAIRARGKERPGE
jgi:hypothetical protein